MPSCASSRPGCCPGCGAAGAPVGARLVIVGHGLVRRQLRGPLEPGGAPQQLDIVLRRYRCRRCDAVLMVGPRGLVPRRWYGAGAMACAIAAYARGATSSAARAATAPAAHTGASSIERWITLGRWLDAAERGDLFALRGLERMPRRVVAEQVTLALAARGGHVHGGDLAHSAFAGASLAA